MYGVNPTKILLVDVQGSGGSTLAIPPTLINSYTALTITAYWRAITFLCTNLASFGRSIRREDEGEQKRHPLNRLIKRMPNLYQSAFIFWQTLWFHVTHTANGYARIERDTRGQPIALHNVPPEDVLPFRIEVDGEQPEQWYWHRPTKTAIAAADMIHLMGLSHDGMCAMDPTETHCETLDRAVAISRYQTKFLRKGTVVRGSIEIPGHLEKDQLTEFRTFLNENFTGPTAAEDLLLLTDGAKLNNTTLSPNESQLTQQVQLTTKQISQITGVPPEFLFELSEAKYNASVELAGQFVTRYTFRTWIEQCEDELSRKLLSEAELDAGYEVHINPDALVRGDTKTQQEIVTQSVGGPTRTVNEGRALLGLPRDADPTSDKIRPPAGATSIPSASPSSSSNQS